MKLTILVGSAVGAALVGFGVGCIISWRKKDKMSMNAFSVECLQ